jgi:phage protein D
MGRGTADKLAQQDEARKSQYTNMVTETMGQIPTDYTPQQKADITTNTLGTIDTQFKNNADEMARRASATGSGAGLPESLLENTRESAQTKAQAASGLAQQFANVPVQRALQKASIFAPALGGMQGEQQASNTSFLDNILASAAGGIGGAFSKSQNSSGSQG